MAEIITQEKIIDILDSLYSKATDGIQMVSPPISVLANDYLSKHIYVDISAKKFIKNQVVKCTTSGFVTGLGGFITLPVAIPDNISSVLYVQLRMIACIAHMGGYDTKSDQVQTLAYACLAGVAVDQVVKKAGIEIGSKLATAMIKKIPGSVLTKINRRAGFKLLTKFGSKGVINLSKGIPLVGGFISGGFDFVETKIIADRAYKMFIKGSLSIVDTDK